MSTPDQIIEYGFVASVTRPGNDMSTLTIIILNDEVKTRRFNIKDKTQAWKPGHAVSLRCAKAGNCANIKPCAWASPALPALFNQVKTMHTVFNQQNEAYEALQIDVEIQDKADIQKIEGIKTSSSLTLAFGIGTGVFGLFTLNPWMVGMGTMTTVNGANGDSAIKSIIAAIEVRHNRIKREHAKLINTRKAFIDLLCHAKLALAKLALEELVAA